MKLSEINKNSWCLRCRYLIPDPDGLGVRCAAFDKIPRRYTSGGAVHRRVDADQIGTVVFTPKNEEHAER